MVKLNYRVQTQTGVRQRQVGARRQIDAIRKRVAKAGKKWDSAKIVRAIRDGK